MRIKEVIGQKGDTALLILPSLMHNIKVDIGLMTSALWQRTACRNERPGEINALEAGIGLCSSSNDGSLKSVPPQFEEYRSMKNGLLFESACRKGYEATADSSILKKAVTICHLYITNDNSTKLHRNMASHSLQSCIGDLHFNVVAFGLFEGNGLTNDLFK